MEITDYDKWKFRRCLETINRYGCTGTGYWKGKCGRCKFNIVSKKWNYLHTRLIIGGNPDRIVINDVSE